MFIHGASGILLGPRLGFESTGATPFFELMHDRSYVGKLALKALAKSRTNALKFLMKMVDGTDERIGERTHQTSLMASMRCLFLRWLEP